LIKEEISFYFRMVLGRGVAGPEQAPHGWEAENARHYERLQRGKGGASFPKSMETSILAFDKC
jgi:hypothetical protein